MTTMPLTQNPQVNVISSAHHRTSAGHGWRVRPVVMAAAILGSSGSILLADQILETYSDSLTSYQYTSATAIQAVRPQVTQRGVNLDGSLRLGSTFPMALAGNPFGDGAGWSGNRKLDSVNMNLGAIELTEVDLSLPAKGFSWVIGRSYNGAQKDSGGSHLDSNGYQGRNWFQMSQPEIVLYDDATNTKDVIYLIYGADRFLEFNRTGTSSNEYKGKNGAAGVVQFASGGVSEPDTFTYTDSVGNQFVFFGFDADASTAAGQFWKAVDPAGNTAYVGDATTGSTAISSGYSSGKILKAYDTSDRRYTYTYTTIDSVSRLTQVKAETKTSGTWASPSGVAEVGKVDYAFYQTGDNTYGDNGCLKSVTRTIPLTDSGISSTQTEYFRYYVGAYNASTNKGNPYGIKMIVHAEGYRRYDWDQDSNLDDDPLSASVDNLKPYSASFFEYDSSFRVTSAWMNGECGCSGGANGTYTLSYGTNGSYTDNSGYDTTWCKRTVVTRPDSVWITQYFDEVAQPLSKVLTAGDPANTSPAPDRWLTEVVRNSDGQITEVRSPAANSSYTHSSGSISASSSAGLIRTMTRLSSTDMKGFVEYSKHKNAGTGGSEYYDSKMEYGSATKTIGGSTLTRPLTSLSRKYTTESTVTTTGVASTVTNTAFGGSTTLALKQVQSASDAVATANNGSNSATSTYRFARTDGTTAFSQAPDGIFTYMQYTNGLLTKRIDDAQTNNGSDFASGDDPNTDYGITETGDGVRRITTYTYDAQGRLDTTTMPDGLVTKMYYSKLADGRLVTLAYPKYDTSPSTKFYGPVRYSVSNLAGGTEASGVIALTNNETTTALTGHIDETTADPISAVLTGTVAQMSTNTYDSTGTKVQQARVYFLIPGSGAGTEGTNYDATRFGYDDMGRKWRTKEPTGTIRRTTYEAPGRMKATYIGTNDNSFSGGEASGPDNMVKISEVEYDSGSAGGNSYVTKRTAFVEDSTTDRRDTTYTNDARGRAVVIANPQAPHGLNLYDNLGRVVASGQYSSTSGLTVTTDPTATATNRMALSETFYDVKGQVYKTLRHKIDAADGSDDDTLETLTWYDSAGRTIKVAGSSLTKTVYDRLGRATRRYTLAEDDDTAYSAADDVSGDIVLSEQITAYESTNSDDVLLSVSISRLHNDYDTGETTGALDTNADSDALKITSGNVAKGRVQITAMWYDDFDRLTDTVSYGTNDASANVATFDRNALSVPARSDTALRTSYTYNTDGTTKEVTDPKGIVTRTEYDAMGRAVTVIRNYVNGTPSGTTADDDVITRNVFTNGLQTKLFVDLDGDNVEDATDQVTLYTYGTTKGSSVPDSKIATGHMLQKVTYPDSTSGTDTVTYAYNAQAQEIYKKDQLTNVIQSDYDTGGKKTHTRVTTLTTGDGAVRRISLVYDSLSRVSTVTQYDNATVGSGSVVDELKYTYDNWGPISKFEQDRNSAVGTGSDQYYVSYAYSKAGTGSATTACTRRTIRKDTMKYGYGPSTDQATLTYEYLSTSGLHDDDLSRVTRVKLSTTALATYAYNGVSELVGTKCPEIDVWTLAYDPASLASFRDLDRFNRIAVSRWTKDLSTDVDFYNVALAYDRNGNITRAEDAITGAGAGYDVEYTNDNLNRLTKAEEGSWNGSAITSRSRQQIWTLTQTGNWDRAKLDLNGDNDFVDSGETDDTRTHNVANELTARDTDSNASNNYTLTYDDDGQLTDDGQSYKYVYDAFGRIRQVKNQSNTVIAEYWYNGLGYRITVLLDTNNSGAADGSDTKFHLAWDERWRQVATFRESDSSPKEQFINHQAGLSGGVDGSGGASYIDTVICREKDANTAWTSASDGVLEERRYYCQNWRADVSALLTSGGLMVEWVKYSSYGSPFGLPGGDADSSGNTDATDTTQIQTWINTSAYDVRGDINLNGVVNASDKTTVTNNYVGTTLGWNNLSAIGNRKGYAGYEWESQTTGYHVRHRYLRPDLGRWIRRDPLGYVDGVSLYEYVMTLPIRAVDPSGTRWSPGRTGPQDDDDGDNQKPPPNNTTPPPCCSKIDCRWTWQIDAWYVGGILGGGKLTVWGIGVDSTGCTYSVNGTTKIFAAGLTFGYFQVTVDDKNYDAPCMWPVEVGDEGAMAIFGYGSSFLPFKKLPWYLKPLKVMPTQGFARAGDFEGFGTFFLDSGGGGLILFGGGAKGWFEEDELTYSGPTPPPGMEEDCNAS